MKSLFYNLLMLYSVHFHSSSPILSKNFLESSIVLEILSLVAEFITPVLCFNLLRFSLISILYPVTLWNMRTCLSPVQKTYFPVESNLTPVIGPRNIFLVIHSAV